MAVQIPGLIAIIIFYLIITIIGIVVGRKMNIKGTTAELFIANRDLGLFVASLTMTATNVGGGYIAGTAEAFGRDGLLWCIGPVGYNIGFCIVTWFGMIPSQEIIYRARHQPSQAAVVFAPKARRAGYTTILDPMQIKYGEKMGALLFIPELCATVLWEAAILAALGTTLSIILDINMVYSIVVSATIAVGYTFFGGLFSVVYTDVIQLFFIFIGLVIAIPFSVTSPAVDFHSIHDSWIGNIPKNMIGLYIDTWCLVIIGALPWQALYQRILACKTPAVARDAILIGSCLSFVFAVPPAVIGAVGRATDWNMTDFDGEVPLTFNQWAHIFPMVLQYVCPKAVSIIGIGAMAAAVMSSTDSCILATGSVFTHNVYRELIRTKASETELIWVLRVAMLVAGALGTIVAITVESVYVLFIMSADMMYVVQFPQLFCAFWIPFSNVYGSLAGFVIAVFLRIAGGEPFLRIPALLKYPMYDVTSGQLFPFKTFSMGISLIVIPAVSYAADYVFNTLELDAKYDFLKGFQTQMETQDKQERPRLITVTEL